MRDVIETTRYIRIQHLAIALAPDVRHPFNGPMTVSIRPKPTRVGLEQRLEQRFQQLPQDLLRNPVTDYGNAQRANLLHGKTMTMYC